MLHTAQSSRKPKETHIHVVLLFCLGQVSLVLQRCTRAAAEGCSEEVAAFVVLRLSCRSVSNSKTVHLIVEIWPSWRYSARKGKTWRSLHSPSPWRQVEVVLRRFQVQKPSGLRSGGEPTRSRPVTLDNHCDEDNSCMKERHRSSGEHARLCAAVSF